MSKEWDKKISSAGPDEGTFCTLYSYVNFTACRGGIGLIQGYREHDCWGKALPFTYPGIKRLARYGYDDTVSSVRCDFITGFKKNP
jgi:hypothetical protein